MSASKLFAFGTSLFRAQAAFVPPLPPKTLLIFPPTAASLRFRGFSSSFAAAEDVSEASQPPLVLHPWPEWVNFVDRLKSKGYLVQQPPNDESGNEDAAFARESGGSVDGGAPFKDMNALKEPCLSFARDRYDIFKSLSVQHIQRVVEQGCPNLLRKAVNSAKRLRAFVRLDEGDVCSMCNLRGSCDRAYVIVKESEAEARTVDIMRILMHYALDPLVFSGGQKPPGRELVESSARILLCELVELSETSPAPELPKPVKMVLHTEKSSMKYTDDKSSKDVEMKRGDWMCPTCNFLNFAKNIRCLRCGEDGPKRVHSTDFEMKKGDWICSACNFMNFSRNMQCLKCKADGPKKVSVDEVEMKKGDWNCPQCSFMNFASNRKCLRCRENRPKRQLNYGEWECPECDFLNYRRNKACLKCNRDRPKETSSEYEEQLWRSP